jgi:hypothetical protein
MNEPIELREVLQDGIVNVTFTKVDGSQRDMRCTLNESLIPQTTSTEPKTERKVNDTVQRVFDLDKNEWRSFRKDSVIEFHQE